MFVIQSGKAGVSALSTVMIRVATADLLKRLTLRRLTPETMMTFACLGQSPDRSLARTIAGCAWVDFGSQLGQLTRTVDNLYYNSNVCSCPRVLRDEARFCRTYTLILPKSCNNVTLVIFSYKNKHLIRYIGVTSALRL